LQWHGDPDGTYRIQRCQVGERSLPETVAEVRGTHWIDREAPRGVLLEYSVTALNTPQVLPARLRLVRQEHPAEWAIELENGLGLSLLTGAVHATDPDLQVHQIVGNRVMLRCAEWSPLASSPTLKTRASQRKNQTVEPWVAPPFENRGYMHNIRSVEVGASAFFYLTKPGVYGRITVSRDTQGRILLTRSLAWNGGRVLPLPPVLDSSQIGANSIDLVFECVPRKGLPNPDRVTRVIEVETDPGSGQWSVLDEVPAYKSVQTIPISSTSPDLPVVPLRFRHRVGELGLSLPSEAIAVLAVDPENTERLEAVRDAALEALAAESFDQRLLGERVLRSLGDVAWPALLEIYRDEQGISADLARQILLSPEGLQGGQLETVMRIAGEKARIETPAPGLWFHPDPDWRLFQILIDHGRAEWEPWLHLMGRLDPDARVRELAKLLLSSPDLPLVWQDEGMHGLMAARRPPEGSSLATEDWPGWPDWAWELDGAAPIDVAYSIRKVVEGARLWESQALLALARMAESDPRDHNGQPTMQRILVGLGLVRMHRSERKSVLLEALREGLVTDGSNLRAWRDLMDWRLHEEPDTEAPVREVVRLPDATLAALQQTLSDIEIDGRSYIDVVLPAGVYGEEGGQDRWVDLGVDGLALIGEDGVRIQAGLRATGVRDLVVVNLAVDHTAGSALTLTGAMATLRGVTLGGAQTCIALQDSIVELDRCFVNSAGDKPSAFAARLTGPSLLLSRASRWRAGTVLLGERGQAYFDRCILEAGSRPIIQGQRGGHLVLRDSVLASGSIGMQGLSEILMEGVYSVLHSQTIGPQVGQVHVCPDHTRATEAWRDWPGVQISERCPLRPNR